MAFFIGDSMPEYEIPDDGTSLQNQKGRAISSILPEVNRSDIFIVLCCKFLEEQGKNQYSVLRWAERYHEDDMIAMLAYIFSEEYITEEIISKAWRLSHKVREEKNNEL